MLNEGGQIEVACNVLDSRVGDANDIEVEDKKVGWGKPEDSGIDFKKVVCIHDPRGKKECIRGDINLCRCSFYSECLERYGVRYH